jgi:hypothetical protein
MDDKWQLIIAECEKLSSATGVPVPRKLDPGNVAITNPWVKEGILLDWLAGVLGDANAALQKHAEALRQAQDAAANMPAADPKKTTRRLDT